MAVKPKTPKQVWEKVKIGLPDECWEWFGSKSHNGYGRYWMNWRSYPAHRVVYWLIFPNQIELKVGRVSKSSVHVLHKCDNPACCNPSHLFLGTLRDNHRDMIAKNRRADFDGENGQNAKLRSIDVERIREAYLFGAKHKDLAEVYGVSVWCINGVIERRTYRNV